MNKLFPHYNFCGLQKKYSKKETSRFHILPVPYEATTSYGQGTALGPKATIDASLHIETYDEELGLDTYKLGIHTLPFVEPKTTDPEHMANELTKIVYNELSAGKNEKLLISLGGEHSISPGLVKAFRKKYADLSVLHLDAHADLRDSFQGTKYSHACANRRILEYCPSVSCGIRSLSREEADFIKETGKDIFFEKDALDKINKINSLLSQNIYITLDLDVLDPSIMPSTGTPEPGGWTWHELCGFLKKIILNKNVVGIDVVELSPINGMTAPDFTSAKLIYRIMGYAALSKGWISAKPARKFTK